MRREYSILFIAVACGTLAFILAFNYLKKASSIENQFVAAASAIEKGHLIQEEDLTVIKTRERIPTEDLYFNIEDVVNKEALADIPAGKTVHRSQTKTPIPVIEKKPSLSIPPGMRALTISNREADSIPEFLEVGGYVDILGMLTNYAGKSEMKTIVESAQVLSINEQKSGPPSSFSIAVYSKEAETVIKAISAGRIRVIARADKGSKRSAEPAVGTIEIIRGTNREKKLTFGEA